MNSAFIHEGIIYEYMNHRFSQNSLYLFQKISDGSLIVKEKKVKVKDLDKIVNTRFPDVDGIVLPDSNLKRPAEIKFVTSSFDYHKDKKKKSDYIKFKNENGFIIALKHDYLPAELLNDYVNLDVYELDYNDFISFAQENFNRLLNRQLKLRQFSRIWIMMQSKNFSTGADGVLPARESHIWCPSENLTTFDLDVNDKVLFIKTSGSSYQAVGKEFNKEGKIKEKWSLQEIFIGSVTSNIMSRDEYCSISAKNKIEALWYDETPTGKKDPRIYKRKASTIRWNKVFEFDEKKQILNIDIEFNDIFKDVPDFVLAVIAAFTQQRSTEINHETYEALLEFLT